MEDAIGLADTVEKIFNGQNEIEDMSIDKYTRALFYELLKEKLLKVRREEYKEKGKNMRKFYWSYNLERIQEEARRKHRKDIYGVYREIPPEVWTKRSSYTNN
ncbi:MAG TPA: hypothetical protein ENI44_05165 [Thermoplasmatales archaeon]|nr:hypothetical protein [Thermoplasmatales archaeon]